MNVGNTDQPRVDVRSANIGSVQRDVRVDVEPAYIQTDRSFVGGFFFRFAGSAEDVAAHTKNESPRQ